jgi:pimeloyl-ACP methyl ester carboxylesterase
MERSVDVPIEGGLRIVGVWNGQSEAQWSDKLIIQLHGLTGWKDTHIHQATKNVFVAAGYDVYRFDFYDGTGYQRSLRHSTLTTHVADTQAVVNYWRPQYKKIYLTGHSIGGLVLMMANIEGIRAMSLWDACYDFKRQFDMYGLPFSAGEQCYIAHWTTEQLIGKAFIDECMLHDAARCNALAAHVKTPTQVVMAEHGNMAEFFPENFDAALGGEKERVVVAGAGHTFTQEGTAEKLATETLQWFNKF